MGLGSVQFLKCLLLCLLPVTVKAFPLALPVESELRIKKEVSAGSYDFPVSAWYKGIVATRSIEGAIARSVWRITKDGQTTLEVFALLRQQLIEQDFEIVFECHTNNCGGFDFRFAIDLIGAPDMLIDLGNFRALTARLGDQWILLFVSGTQAAHFIQIITSDESAEIKANLSITGSETILVSEGSVAQQLQQNGRVILSDLTFDTGASELAPEPFDSLAQLATFLNEHPDISIALVGHTDSFGSLETNIALSKRRAVAVKDRLIADYAVDTNQLEAEGMGYLSPIAPNQTENGREANRRVEAIITHTE